MKRILYVEANEDGTVGGSHKLLFDLATRLSPEFVPVVLFYEDNIWAGRLAELGIETITWNDVRAAERPGLTTGGKVSTVVTLVRAVSTRVKLLRDLEIDLVHLNNSPDIGYDDWLPAARLAGVSCVVTAMGPPGKLSNPLVRAVASSFDTVFPLSRYIERAVARNGVDPDRITLTYPGVDVALADAVEHRSRADVRSEFGLADGQVLVSMVGNVRPWKGQHVVLEALGSLGREDLGRLKVLFVGQLAEEDADYQQRLDRMIEEHDLGEVVEFTGRRDDVPELLEASDIAIHASVEAEPFGLVVQEAMLHGCATIAADEGGPPEIVTEDSGITFDADLPAELASHLRTLVHDAELRARLSEQARRRARTFDVRDYVGRIEDRYLSLLGA